MRDSRREADLSRFVEAHDRSYSRALEEIREGRKQSHWMWYIFPQIVGLGLSSTSSLFAVEHLKVWIRSLRHVWIRSPSDLTQISVTSGRKM